MVETITYPASEPETSIVFNAFQHLDEFNELINEACILIGDIRKEESLLTRFTSSYFAFKTPNLFSNFRMVSRTAPSFGSIPSRNAWKMHLYYQRE